MMHYNPTEIFPYVYLLHHLPSNSYYIGSRSQNVRYRRPLEAKIEENRKRSESLKQTWAKRKATENNTNNI